MRILISIGHPADVHLFRYFINEMVRMGHDIFVIARDKEITYSLLDKFGIAYYPFSTHKKALFSKITSCFLRWIKTYQFCKKVAPHVSIGVGDFITPQISKSLLAVEEALT